MVATESIKIDEQTKKLLDKKRIYERETYDDIIKRILEKDGNNKSKN